jgi:hypothetical protein
MQLELSRTSWLVVFESSVQSGVGNVEHNGDGSIRSSSSRLKQIERELTYLRRTEEEKGEGIVKELSKTRQEVGTTLGFIHSVLSDSFTFEVERETDRLRAEAAEMGMREAQANGSMEGNEDLHLSG